MSRNFWIRKVWWCFNSFEEIEFSTTFLFGLARQLAVYCWAPTVMGSFCAHSNRRKTLATMIDSGHHQRWNFFPVVIFMGKLIKNLTLPWARFRPNPLAEDWCGLAIYLASRSCPRNVPLPPPPIGLDQRGKNG